MDERIGHRDSGLGTPDSAVHPAIQPGPAPRDIIVRQDLEALSAAAAGEVVAIARSSIAARGRFVIALAGGSTPRRTYELLAERHREDIDWSRVDVVFGDERFVPPDDERNNYRMARDALLARVPIPGHRVHAVPTTEPTAEQAAVGYEHTLRTILGSAVEGAGADAPAIDLALLGMGRDGHTASLFPGSPLLEERERWVRAAHAPPGVEPAVDRITMTLPLLNRSRVALFLVAGADKRALVQTILGGGERAFAYPAALIAPRERLVWMLAP